MNKKYIIQLILGISLLFAVSCSEDEIDFYSGPASVNFYLYEGDGIFVEDEDITEKEFMIRFYIQAPAVEKERTIKLEFGERQTAVAGKNFELPSEIVLEAGRMDTVIVCKAYKEGLTYDPLLIDLKVGVNEDFAGGGVYDRLEIKMMLGYPLRWKDPTGWAAEYYLGPCTQAKYKFVKEQIGTLDLTDYQGAWGSGYLALAERLNQALIADPRTDDDGSPMRFGN